MLFYEHLLIFFSIWMYSGKKLCNNQSKIFSQFDFFERKQIKGTRHLNWQLSGFENTKGNTVQSVVVNLGQRQTFLQKTL